MAKRYPLRGRLIFAFLVVFAVGEVLLLSHRLELEGAAVDAPLVLEQQASRSRQKPLFVIHVGPPKTATSTLQQEMILKYRPFLRQDNYTYLGNRAGLTLNESNRMEPEDSSQLQAMFLDQKCQMEVAQARYQNKSVDIPCFDKLRNELRSWENNAKNVILSHENMGAYWIDLKEGPGPFDWVSMKRALKNWDVLVVVGYRRFAEWLPSCIYEEEKPGKKPRRHLWRQYGGKHPDPFLPKLRNYMMDENVRMFRYTNHVIEAFRKHFSVVLLNMHEPKGVVPTFLCDILPDAKNACQESLKQQTSTDRRANQASQEELLDYDRIVTDAADKGLFNVNLPNLTRDIVVGKAKHFHEEVLGRTPKDLPVQCLESSKLSLLLKQSLNLEKKIASLGVYASDLDERAHAESFWDLVEEKKFCSVDTAAVLRDEPWKQFFLQLAGQNHARTSSPDRMNYT